MFGLRIVKSSDYSSLENQIQALQDVLVKKDSEINFLASENNALSAKIDTLQEEIANLKAPKKADDETILLTDVAETPLKVEKTQRKKTVRKTTGTTTRKKIVHKGEE